MGGDEGIAFVSGVAIGFLLFIFVFVVALDLREPIRIITDKKLEFNNVYYNVTIDTVKTDSLFGKTWRK